MDDKEKQESERPTQIGIYYQRSRHYRTIHADGAQIGVTPRGEIQFTLFSDLKPMPEFVLHQITPEGNLGASLEEVVKDGPIREVEVNVVMDVLSTTALANALRTTLEQLEELKTQRAEPTASQER